MELTKEYFDEQTKLTKEHFDQENKLTKEHFDQENKLTKEHFEEHLEKKFRSWQEQEGSRAVRSLNNAMARIRMAPATAASPSIQCTRKITSR